MLHTGMLPHHAIVGAASSPSLRYVVIDELHTYRGVFGSHLANVLRRLERVARFHGATPRFMFASATIGNPQEHAARMLGREVALVERERRAARAQRRLLVYNPPVVNAELGIRQTYVKAAARLTADLVQRRGADLLFGQSRNTVEVMLKYLRDALAEARLPGDWCTPTAAATCPQTRRDIEAGLRDG